MWKIRKYTGVEADIFSLGVLLFNLVSAKCGFGKATNNDPYYSLIIDGTYKAYWELVEKAINLTPSDNFKDLYTKLIAYEPKNRPINLTPSDNFKDLYTKLIAYEPKNRLSIEEILQYPWFNEIKNLSIEEEKKEIEVKLKEIYDKIKNVMKQLNMKII